MVVTLVKDQITGTTANLIVRTIVDIIITHVSTSIPVVPTFSLDVLMTYVSESVTVHRVSPTRNPSHVGEVGKVIGRGKHVYR